MFCFVYSVSLCCSVYFFVCKCVLYCCQPVAYQLQLTNISHHINVVRLSTLRSGRLYPQELFLVLISVRRLSQPQGHNAVGRIISMKISSDTIENRTRDPPACNEVPQPTVPQRAPNRLCNIHYVFSKPNETVKLKKRLEFSTN
jgi:hypothetical protein